MVLACAQRRGRRGSACEARITGAGPSDLVTHDTCLKRRFSSSTEATKQVGQHPDYPKSCTSTAGTLQFLQNSLASLDDACTSLPSHPLLCCCSPSLNGRKRERCSSAVPSARQNSSNTEDKSKLANSHYNRNNKAPWWAQQTCTLSSCFLPQ